MYDINRESNPSLCEMRNNELCYYIGGSTTIQSITKRSHHYEKQNNIVELIENIARELFYYSSSLQKISAKYEQTLVKSVLLDNIKRITIHNCDKYGLIREQKLFYLIVSYLHSLTKNNTNLREYLNQVHYILTCNAWQMPHEQIPYSLVMFLNGQYEQLLNYTREEMMFKSSSQQIQLLVDLLVYKIQEKQSEQSSQLHSHQQQSQASTTSTTYTSTQQLTSLIDNINSSQWMKNLIAQIKRKNLNVFSLFSSKLQIEILLGVIAGNSIVIEQVAKGSWGLYLNLYINYIKNNTNINNKSIPPQQSYQQIILSYLQKYTSTRNTNNKFSPTQSQQQLFLIKVINSSSSSSSSTLSSTTSLQSPNRYSFHEIYQQSFSILSPVLGHLIGLLLLQCKLVDLYSMINNKQYYQEILLNLIDSSNCVSWSAFVHIIGFVNNGAYLNSNYNENAQSNMWQHLLYQHLPYQLQINNNNQHNLLSNQIKQIQQKLQDLNIIGLSSITKSYLTQLFTIQLNPSNSNNLLNEQILQVFFLTLQMSDSSTANICFHQMKSFLTGYYRNSYFNFQLLQVLESIFERKHAILSEKMQKKIQKLFCLMYKIKAIKDIAVIGYVENDQIQQQQHQYQYQQSVLIQQLRQFNKLFLTNKYKKHISLSVQLLKLGQLLHKAVQNTISFNTNTQLQMQLQTVNHQQQQQQLQQQQQQQQQRQQQQPLVNTTKSKTSNHMDIVKQFKKNLTYYLQQWNIYIIQHQQSQQLSQTSINQLSYFNNCFY